MDIFNEFFGGAARRSGRCHTAGCERLTTNGLPFCNRCISARIKTAAFDGDEALDALPTRPMTDLTLPAVTDALHSIAAAMRELAERAHAASLFAHASAQDRAEGYHPLEGLDAHCAYCRVILAEHQLTRSARVIDPLTSEKRLPRIICAAHQPRYAAWQAVSAEIDKALRAGKSSELLAVEHTYGYLGDALAERLADDQPFP